MNTKANAAMADWDDQHGRKPAAAAAMPAADALALNVAREAWPRYLEGMRQVQRLSGYGIPTRAMLADKAKWRRQAEEARAMLDMALGGGQ